MRRGPLIAWTVGSLLLARKRHQEIQQLAFQYNESCHILDESLKI